MKRIDISPISDSAARENEVSESLKGWLLNTPDPDGRGQSVATIRKRFKVIDKIEDAVSEGIAFVDLEDAEYAILQEATAGARFAHGDKTILKIEDRVLEAKAPPKAEA